MIPDALSVRRRWCVLSAALVLGLTVAGCAPASRPAATHPPPTVTLVARLTGTPEPAPPTPAVNRTPTAIRRTPSVVALELNQTLETDFLPGEASPLYELVVTDTPLRVTLQIIPADGQGELALRAQLFTADGERVPHSAASGAGDALSGTWDVVAAGTYYVQLFGAETQRRTVKLLAGVQPHPQAARGGGRIAYGETRSGAITVRGQRDVWTFAGQGGDAVLIRVVAPTADLVLALYDPAQALLAEVDDAPTGGGSFSDDPQLAITLPVSGTYTVQVRVYGDAHTGSYQIALERTEP